MAGDDSADHVVAFTSEPAGPPALMDDKERLKEARRKVCGWAGFVEIVEPDPETAVSSANFLPRVMLGKFFLAKVGSGIANDKMIASIKKLAARGLITLCKRSL